MEFLSTLFEVNNDIIFFVYGLVFFLLGTAIALQSRHYSRLELARTLKWLAAFGFTHGLHEWGEIFIPIQAQYLGPTATGWLHKLQLLLLAVSFACLVEFGVTLLRPLNRARWLRGASSTLFAIWFILVYFPLSNQIDDFGVWQNTANALARYLLGFPGGMLAAYGLREHAFLGTCNLSGHEKLLLE